MSQINNVITTTFRARGNQAIASMGQISQSFGQLGNVINQNTRMSERLNAQWRAIGTTIRYAIAGTAVFGLTRMVGQLKEVQRQMGLISSIAETAGGAPLVGQQLTNLMNETQAGAVAAITPINDYNNAVINLLSTVQGIPQNQITPIVTEISRAAQLAQVSAEDATKAFTTMNVAFGRPTNLPNIRKMAQEFFILTREAPGGVAAGQQIITQLGQLAQVTRAAHGTPEDMFSLLLSSLRAGIPPAQTGRGLQYLLQTLALPGSQAKPSQEALASVGIVPASNMPLQQRLARVFGRARRLGIRGDLGRLKNLDEETLGDLEAQGTTGGLGQLGITGRGAEFLGTIFRRIHALRTALAISGQIDVGQAQSDLDVMQEAAQGHVSAINDLSKAWKRFEKRAKLQAASVALDAMSLQVAQVFEPILNFTADRIMGGVQFAQRHRDLTKAAVIGGGTFAAAIGASRLLGLGNMSAASPLGYIVNRLPRPVRRFLGGAGPGVGQALVAANAIQASISGNAAIGGSPQNPLYVVVVGQLFGGGGGGMGPGTNTMRKSGPGAGDVGEDVARDVGAWQIAKNIFGRGKRIGRKALGLPGAAGAARAAGIVGASTAAIGLSEALGFLLTDMGAASENNRPSLKRAQEIIGNRAGGRITGIEGAEERMLRGQAELYLTLDVLRPDGKKAQVKVHMPVTMWEKGRVPTRSGKRRPAGRK